MYKNYLKCLRESILTLATYNRHNYTQENDMKCSTNVYHYDGHILSGYSP